jgi:hypothetical protein
MKSLYLPSHFGGADKTTDAFCWYDSNIVRTRKEKENRRKNNQDMK